MGTLSSERGYFGLLGIDHILVYYSIISYQGIEFYRFEIMDMGGFRWNNCFSGRYNPSNYGSIIARYDNSFVGIVRYSAMPC